MALVVVHGHEVIDGIPAGHVELHRNLRLVVQAEMEGNKRVVAEPSPKLPFYLVAYPVAVLPAPVLHDFMALCKRIESSCLLEGVGWVDRRQSLVSPRSIERITLVATRQIKVSGNVEVQSRPTCRDEQVGIQTPGGAEGRSCMSTATGDFFNLGFDSSHLSWPCAGVRI